MTCHSPHMASVPKPASTFIRISPSLVASSFSLLRSSNLSRENDRIFGRTWQVVGHRHQVATPGDYFTFDLLGEPLLLVRGRTETCAVSITSAVIGPVPRPKGAVPESCSAVDITGGPMGSTDRLGNAPEFDDV